ncbi:MAG TPA: GTP 3',8-cyclase MoaA [Gemmataceae bacterium]|jgi:cyclic pyranopterin phosphate synthase|nr:GTP 3',8-cyclase MoaA [Gemmataceae bacterium]
MSFRLPLSQSPTAARPTGPVPTAGALVDTFGRIHDNLRISVTDRCNLRCTYCMPEDVTFLPKDALLTFEEIAHFVRVAVDLGVTKVRLTGGEPLLRRDLPRLVEMLVAIPGLHDLGLTTNGLLLAAQARSLRDAGLRRLNVSLDTLDADRFRELSRRDGLDQVLNGLAVARDAGFERIKVNAVAIRGLTELDVVPLAHYCRDSGFDLRFIEYMPIGADPWERDKVLPASEILDELAREFGDLTTTVDHDPHAPALEFAYADGRGTVGIIASITRPFCMQCNRLRLTADGKVRNCLFALDEVDVRHLLRPRPDDATLGKTIRAVVWDKWEGHEINTARFIKPTRTMHAIGG